ncbi:GYF domain-containing protein [Zavarzinella formosa]|uniref:GYF domain-containing protein n=1 Tax=Zavarzinella formosa TaxID=360055 RepID=UPI000495358E|nr:GYF domain-containing protein [Zavarzinella formosa]
MNQDWYHTANGGQHGPVTAVELKKRAQSGMILPEDLVWKEGMPNWVPAKSVKGLFGPAGGKSGETKVTTAKSGEIKRPVPVETSKPVEPKPSSAVEKPPEEATDSPPPDRLAKPHGKSTKEETPPSQVDEIEFLPMEEEEQPKQKPRRDESEEEEERPKRKSRQDDEDDEEERPKQKSRRDDDDEEEEEERPKRKSRRDDEDDEDDDRSSRSSRRRDDDDEDEDERPSRSARRRYDDDDDEDEDDRPRSSRRRYDEDDEDDYDDRPKRRKKRNGLKPGTGLGIGSMICGILGLVLTLSSCFLGAICFLGLAGYALSGILSVVAICLGFPAMKTEGKGFGLAGLITGFIGLIPVLIAIVGLIFGFAALGINAIAG